MLFIFWMYIANAARKNARNIIIITVVNIANELNKEYTYPNTAVTIITEPIKNAQTPITIFGTYSYTNTQYNGACNTKAIKNTTPNTTALTIVSNTDNVISMNTIETMIWIARFSITFRSNSVW